MEASQSAHLYTHSLHPDTVPLSLIPLEDLPSGLGFVMSELVPEWDLHTQETLPIKRLIESPDPIPALLGKFFLRKTEVTQASRIIRLHSPSPSPPPCWESAFAGKCYFQKLNSFAALASIPFLTVEHFQFYQGGALKGLLKWRGGGCLCQRGKRWSKSMEA